MGNTTLLVEFNDRKAIAILNTGARVSIATKSLWQKWGKLALRRTCMQLQLADGTLAKPLGMLKRVTVTSCGIACRDPNYEVILGQPFMRQMLVVQDWGYNYLYLRHDGVTTRVNLSTHKFRDVAKLPIADFESATISKHKGSSSLYEGEDNFWLFQAEETEHIAHHAATVDKEIEIMAKNLSHIELDEDKSSQEWMHILATIDTCAIPTETQFCDEDGYDIIPVKMIKVVDASIF